LDHKETIFEVFIDLTKQWSEFVIASRKSGVAISSTEAGLLMHRLTWNIPDFLC
jgi:hypothetical protein